MILYQGTSASFFRHTSDARFALAHGWSEDGSSYVPVVLSPAEEAAAVDLCEQWRLGCNLTDVQRTAVANYLLQNADADPGAFAMPGSPENIWP